MISEIWGQLLLFIIMIVQVILPPVPAELIVIGAGKKYGILEAALISGTGLWTGSILVYLIGKYLRDRFALFFVRENVQKITGKLLDHQMLILWIRVLPYNPSDVISYAAGIIRIAPKRFVAVTMCTSYLRCLALTTMGEAITSWKEILLALSLLIISGIAAHLIISTRKNKK